MSARVARFSRNATGRDFVVGDLHGCFATLERLLGRVGFDPAVDRLFSVGDLVDRGPDSRAALDWLAKPWFHVVRGNHEQFVLDSRIPMELAQWVAHNGGGWWCALDDAERARFHEAMGALPWIIEIETARGTVGIVHADVPYDLDWPAFRAALERGDPRAMEYALWARKRVRDLAAGRPVPRIDGIDLVITGHTPIATAAESEGFVFLDTGAGYAERPGAALSLYQCHPERGRVWRMETGATGRP